MIFLLSLLSLVASNCPIYRCKPQNISFEINQCISYNSTFNSYYLNPCSKSLYCPQISSPGNSTCLLPTAQPQESWPGEECSIIVRCAYGECENSKCQGLLKGEACSVTDECSPGLYCAVTQTCSPQITVGNYGCSQDSDCVNNAGCNITDSGGVCVQYFSLAPNSAISNCTNQMNLICQSSVCSEIIDQFRCGEFVKSPGFTPLMCETDNDCLSTVDMTNNIRYQGNCECSYGFRGIKYCGIFPGDPVATSLIQQWNTWYNTESAQFCNSNRRNSFNCVRLY